MPTSGAKTEARRVPEQVSGAVHFTQNTAGRDVTVRDLAALAAVDRETMARALEHHGYLELAPYGGPSRRRLVTREAEAAGLGKNIDAARFRLARLEGHRRACAFPVFAREHVAAILWTLDFDGIRREVAALPTKRVRLRWLLANHGHLPSAFLASLAECTTRAVEKAKARAKEESSVARYNNLDG